MLCPFCQAENTKVIDSRLNLAGNQIRRRRECVSCSARFTTFETVELSMPRVIKRQGYHCAFDEKKLRDGIMKSLEKRAVTIEGFEDLVSRIIYRIRITAEREVASDFVGNIVMEELRKLDEVAYVRFASVYRSFKDVHDFKTVLSELAEEPEKANQ